MSVHDSTFTQANNDNQRQLQQRTQQLAALHQAALAVASELSLDAVLQQIVDSVRQLVNAQYAALGVANHDGYLEIFIHSGMSREVVAHIGHLPHGLGLLGSIIREKKSIRVPRIDEDERSIGFPPNHPPMNSFLGVPIMGGSETLGNLYMTNKKTARAFSDEDQKLVEMFAAHAAIAIQNARLYEQVGRLAVIEERTRIGMDLHDGVIQAIYAVGLTLESMRLGMRDEPEEAEPLLDQAINGLNDTIRDIRNFILDLRPHRFQGNLHQALARLIREFQANAMVLVSLSAPEESFAGLTTSAARAIFLTTQEALANIARHAKATNVTIAVERTAEWVIVAIEDNGQGFDTQAQQDRMGHGLSNMQARMDELNGRFTLESQPGAGTAITLQIPLPLDYAQQLFDRTSTPIN